jgi:hypothetical protein
MQAVGAQVNFARELHERIRREFPEVRIDVMACQWTRWKLKQCTSS